MQDPSEAASSSTTPHRALEVRLVAGLGALLVAAGVALATNAAVRDRLLALVFSSRGLSVPTD